MIEIITPKLSVEQESIAIAGAVDLGIPVKVCAWCVSNIYQEQIKKVFEVELSHGICKDCAASLVTQIRK